MYAGVWKTDEWVKRELVGHWVDESLEQEQWEGEMRGIEKDQ